MKRFLPFTKIEKTGAKGLFVLFLMFFSVSLLSQEVIINKTAVENPNLCNQFDVTLTVTGNPPPQPQEVVLVIDRSGSMGNDIPNDPNEPIDYAKDAAIDFVNNLFLPANNPTGLNRVAIASYSTTASLNIGLTSSAGKQSVINAINAIVASGWTNIQGGLVVADNELTNHGTFNCLTQRSIILLTDGVANRDNNGNQCSDNQANTICQQNAITAGVNAQTTTINGTVYNQNVFSIGLFGAISGNQQTIATNTINGIQNAGLFTTENAADLTSIYNDIFGQLANAATPLPGQPLVTNQIAPGFAVVAGSIVASTGTTSISGGNINWFVNQLSAETITLNYSINAVMLPDVCGINNAGPSVITYRDSNCQTQSKTANSPDICMPCPSIDTTIERQGCTNFINYAATVDQGGCSAVSENFSWEFFLNDVLVGTSNQTSGTFQYTGGNFQGIFKGVVSYNGTYGTGCMLPTVEAEDTLYISCEIDGWEFECGDDKLVDEYGYNANCNTTTVATIPNPLNNIYEYVVEMVYKGSNPGQTLQFTDSNNVTHTLVRSVPVGTSSNIWVYRGLISGSTNSVTYTTTEALKCKLQSVVVYAFRNVPNASSSSGVFTSKSGYNDVQTITVDIPSFTGPRDLVIETPVSELTNDGRYLLIRAESGGVSDQVIIYGPDASLPGGSCCLAIPSITLDNVPGAATQVVITVDSRNQQNGQTVNGQSWVIASGVNVDGDCFEEIELALDTKTNILCFGDDTGSITVIATGGLPPYEYSLNGGVPQGSPTFNNLVAGVYNIAVEDSIGNTDSISVTLTQPDPLSIQFSKINATATGACMNGQATATPSGGVGPYTYQWSASAGNQTTQTATNLPIGTHTVVVTDANNCTLEQGVVIDCVPNCDAVISIDNVTNVLCKGNNTGSATVSASSVLNPGATFTFTWNTVPPQVYSGVTTSTISNLTAGVYTVSVRIDGTLCLPVEQSITITEPATVLNVTATATDETGPTTGDGTATANPTGGTPPYTYSWSPGGQTTQTITGLSAGTYVVTVTDANGCVDTATAIVNPGSCRNLDANASSTPVSCFGGNDGTATVGVTGGLGPFSYSWSPGGQTTQTITGLTAGTYTVTVTDQSTLCTASSTTTVNQPGALSSGIAVTNVNCYGDSTGSLDLTVTGGTPPYSFLWSPGGQTTEDLSGLSAGTYSVLITDARGCTLNDSATVMQPTAELSLSIISQTDIVCMGLGSVTVEATGGTPPYFYSLDGGAPQGSGVFSDLAEGTYTISVLDGNGCNDSVTVTILKNCTDAINDINNTYQDIPVSGNLLTNDEDEEGDNQIVTTVGTFATTAGGSVSINADGSYTYTPPTGYVGPDTFTYSITDDGNPVATDSAIVFIEVLPINQNTTIANADTAGTEVNTPVTGNVLVNDFDPEGDNQVVTNVGTFPTTQGGSITIAADGSFTYTPPADFEGEDTFEYFIVDDNLNPATDSAILTITVNGDPNKNRTYANDDAYHGNQGATVTGNVLDNDSDPEGHNQFVDTVITPVSGPTNGTLVINANGTFTYVPNDPSFFGTDQFVYEIFDDGSPVARDRATVIITIFGINTTDAVNDINNTFTDVPVAGNVLTNDEDEQGDNQIVTTVGTFPTTAGGSVTMNADGSYIYTPPSGYSGPDTFQYSIADDGNPVATDSATVFIEVLPINQNTTIANADTAGTEVNTPVTGNVLANDFDPEGDNQVVTNVGTFPTTQGGSITIAADGSFTYTPPANFEGEDTFEYFIVDDNLNPATDSAILTITVNGDPNKNRTYANDDAYHGNQGATITGNVLDNDSDPEGHNQFVDTTITPVSGPTNGTLVINADGSFTYVPNDPSFFGNDQFVYEIFDDGSPVARDRATVIITLFGNNTTDAVNDINNTYTNIPVSGNVLTNDEDEEGDNQIVTTVGTFPTTAGGSVTMNADGSYIYTPPAGYSGPDTFQYSIRDDGNPNAVDTATVFIEVLPVSLNTTIANADTAGTEVNTPVTGNVLANDFDPQGDNQVVTNVGTFPTTQGGTITIAADGSFTYTPPANFEGEDTFEYFIIDDNAIPATDSAILTITVNGDPNKNRTYANDDAYNGYQGATITGNVLDNDSDPEGHNQFVDTVITPVSGPTNGVLVINADGSFTYVPNDPSFFGTDQFVYEIFDDGSPVARDQATVIITIFGMNTTYAINDINNTLQDTPVPGNVLTNDRDDQGDNQVVTTVGTFPTTAGGSVTLNADGSYIYTPPAGFVGFDSFPYSIVDDGNPNATDDAVVTIEVIRKISKPNTTIANDDTAQTLVDLPVPGNVLVNDFDPQNDNQ
ncbi:MAG: hypothetical protein CMC14_11400, partial [Flavobacteriaceae bacterium]|nr:hypothetical protein [Flavobacteriaceae bacterium]